MEYVKGARARAGLGVSIGNPATWKAKAGRSQDQGLLGHDSEICLRIKEAGLGIIAQWVEYCLLGIKSSVLAPVQGDYKE